jgi:hypothetical protein
MKKGLRKNPENPASGADGNRNHDLFDANEALYQLSYSPNSCAASEEATLRILVRPAPKRNVGALAGWGEVLGWVSSAGGGCNNPAKLKQAGRALSAG